jgi:hypothetical protein
MSMRGELVMLCVRGELSAWRRSSPATSSRHAFCLRLQDKALLSGISDPADHGFDATLTTYREGAGKLKVCDGRSAGVPTGNPSQL